MLSPKAQYKVGDAKKYFREHLCAGDYYTEGQHVPGHWFGHPPGCGLSPTRI
jgi:hypothetical protein